MLTWVPHLTTAEWSLIGVWAFRIFADAADALPPIPENSGYWKTFWYNFVQKLASNGAKTIVRKP